MQQPDAARVQGEDALEWAVLRSAVCGWEPCWLRLPHAELALQHRMLPGM